MSAKIIHVIVVIILVVLALAILGNSMSKPVGRDEQMYCTGAVYLGQGRMIYRDFSYAAQMPYHPLLCAALFKIFKTTHYLLAVRLVSCVCDILVMLCIVGIYRHILKSFAVSGILLGLGAAVLYVFNPLVDYANGYAWNHDVVILCVVLSFWLFIATDFQQKSRYWRIAAIGALLTLATCMRITTALVELLFLVILLVQPAESVRQRCKTTLPFLTAAACVLIWPVWVIAQAPRAFFLNLVKIPMLYGQWLYEIGMVRDKSDLVLSSLTTPGYFVLIVLTVYLCTAIASKRRRLTIPNKRNMLLAALLPVVFFIIAFIPLTMWRQYLAMPVPFLIISFGLPLSYLRQLSYRASLSKHFRIVAVLIAICVLVAVLSNPVVLYRSPIALVPERWVPIELHTVSEDIAERLKTQDSKLILTLAPLLALEGGCDIYTELSCGSIIYRIADLMSPSERAETHTIGPKTLGPLVEKSPPSAAILGVEMEILEASLLRTAVGPDWKRKVYDGGPLVFFRP